MKYKCYNDIESEDNMKKKIFILLSLIAIVLLTGCTNVDLDLDKVKEKVANLKGNKIDVSLVYGEVTAKEFDYEQYNFNVEDLEEFSFGYNKEAKDFYIIFKAKEGKKKSVKDSIKAFVEDLKKNESNEDILDKLNNYELKEENGYIVAVSNKDLLKIVKNSKSSIFANMMDVPVESIEDVLGIKKEQVEEFVMATPMMIVRSDTYIIVKPSEGNKKAVKEKIDEYMANLETQWETYLPAQYELVKNRLEKELGDYLVYIVSIDNDLVYKTIKDCKK